MQLPVPTGGIKGCEALRIFTTSSTVTIGKWVRLRALFRSLGSMQIRTLSLDGGIFMSLSLAFLLSITSIHYLQKILDNFNFRQKTKIKTCKIFLVSEIFTVQYKTFKCILSSVTPSHVSKANIHYRARTRIGLFSFLSQDHGKDDADKFHFAVFLCKPSFMIIALPVPLLLALWCFVNKQSKSPLHCH